LDKGAVMARITQLGISMGGTVSTGNYESAKAEVSVLLTLSDSEQAEFGLVWVQEKKKLKQLLIEALEEAKGINATNGKINNVE